MKRILYDKANQTMVNRAVHSKGIRERGFSMTIWIMSTTHLLTNTVKSDPIYNNIDQILCVKRTEKFCQGGVQKCQLRGEPKILGWGGQALSFALLQKLTDTFSSPLRRLFNVFSCPLRRLIDSFVRTLQSLTDSFSAPFSLTF